MFNFFFSYKNMDAPKPTFITPSKIKEFPILIGKENYSLSIYYCIDEIYFNS